MQSGGDFRFPNEDTNDTSQHHHEDADVTSQHHHEDGGEEIRISGDSYKQRLVYLLILEETRIQ